MLFPQYLLSASSIVATRYLRIHAFVVVDDCSFRASHVWLSARVPNVALSLVGIVFGPSLSVCIFCSFDFDATVEWIHAW